MIHSKRKKGKKEKNASSMTYDLDRRFHQGKREIDISIVGH